MTGGTPHCRCGAERGGATVVARAAVRVVARAAVPGGWASAPAIGRARVSATVAPEPATTGGGPVVGRAVPVNGRGARVGPGRALSRTRVAGVARVGPRRPDDRTLVDLRAASRTRS
jgi:hypothetical protein